MNNMTLGTSTFLVAVGAIMRFAVSAQGKGFDVHMIGVILMIVGLVAAVLSIALFAGSSRRRTTLTGTRGTVIVEDREVLR